MEPLEPRRLLSAALVADAGPDRLAALAVPVKLTFRGTDAVPATMTFTADWGDGTAPTVQSYQGTQSPLTIKPIFPHTYATRGLYTVTLTVSEGDGGLASDTTTVRVGDVLADLIINADNVDTEPFRPDVPLAGHQVFLDLNGDGLLEDTEPSALSDANGSVLFENVAPGTYSLCSAPLDGYQFYKPPDGVSEITVTQASGSATSFVFTKFAVIAGVVFNDANANGVRDAGEGPLSGRAIQIVGTVNVRYEGLTLFTDSKGAFRSGPTAPGTYLVRLEGIGGWVQTAPFGMAMWSVTVGAAQTASIAFGSQQGLGGIISGAAWNDINADGLKQPDEVAPPFGRYVFLDADNDGQLDPEEARQQPSYWTGEYEFIGLAPGTYTVRLSTQPGWEQTTPATDALTITVATGRRSGGNFATHQVDVTPPTLLNGSYFVDAAGPGLRVEFDEPVLINGPMRVWNLATSTQYTFGVSFDATGRIATYRLQPGSSLPEGSYVTSFVSASVWDLAGNLMKPAGAGFNFAVRAGDANGDQNVDFTDLVLLAQNYNAHGATLGQGDFNFDGVVDFTDLVILAQKYNATAAGGITTAMSTPVNLSPQPAAPDLVLKVPSQRSQPVFSSRPGPLVVTVLARPQRRLSPSLRRK